MAVQLITGFIGLAGVIVGAAGAFGASWLTARGQRLQAAAGRIERQNDVRREASVSFLTNASAFLDLAREVAVALDSGMMSRDDYSELHGRYLAAWHDLVRATATVEIAGPKPIADAATEAQSAIGEVADVCDNWHRARQGGPGNAKWGAFSAANKTARDARTKFVDHAQESQRDPAAVNRA